MNEKTIELLAQDVVATLKSRGYSEAFLNSTKCCLKKIVEWHHQNGQVALSETLLADFINQKLTQKDNGEICKENYLFYSKTAQRITDMQNLHTLVDRKRQTSKFPTNYLFSSITNCLLTNPCWSESICFHAQYNARKFFGWLIEQGINNLSSITNELLKNYILYCAGSMSNASLKDVRFSMRCIFKYLHDHGHVESNFGPVFSLQTPMKRDLKPATDPEEISLTLDVIDTETAVGKRDYAIILLAVVTGLRACDIVNLSLGDIDWKTGEIRITQKKTNNALALPLTKDVGEAIKRYILENRPAIKCDKVFLRSKAPFTGLHKGSLNTVYKKYRELAGFKCVALDGKSFHSLRRTVGKRYVTAGIPVEMIAQVLGHADVKSTDRYISLDTTGLKMCALSLEGIEPEGVYK